MKKYRVIYLDAFTSEPFTGNPCAVLPDADGLTDSQMQKIASETNLSETAFVFRSEKAEVKVRYFSPRSEVPFAGHPTIATAMMLALEKKVPGAKATVVIDFEFNIGVLPVEIKLDSTGRPYEAIMTQQKPSFDGIVAKDELSRCLGLEKSDFIEGMPLQIISTGVPFLMAPVKGMAILKDVRIDRSLLGSLLEQIGVDAVYTFCLEGFEKDTDAYGRLLTSAASSEDYFTGSAAGCMGAYIARYGLHPGPVLKVGQGHLLGRPGTGTVEIIGSNAEIETIKVGGCAVKTMDGIMYIND
ncbi:MAG: PhzF family phenazine biosynthesis protein [Desulfofustis sp.]|jgi:trans-2,3-dihydro-3-hydroxyanthranilate isomerase